MSSNIKVKITGKKFIQKMAFKFWLFEFLKKSNLVSPGLNIQKKLLQFINYLLSSIKTTRKILLKNWSISSKPLKMGVIKGSKIKIENLSDSYIQKLPVHKKSWGTKISIQLKIGFGTRKEWWASVLACWRQWSQRWHKIAWSGYVNGLWPCGQWPFTQNSNALHVLLG